MKRKTRLFSLKTNPAVILQLIGAVLALVVAFGLRLSTTQTGAIMAVATIVASLFVRAKVTSPATAARLIRRAHEANSSAETFRRHANDADEKRRNTAAELAKTSAQYDETRSQLADTQNRLARALEATRKATPARKATSARKRTPPKR